MFKKLFENTPLKSKGDSSAHGGSTPHSPTIERAASQTPIRAVAPVIEISSPSYDQWLRYN